MKILIVQLRQIGDILLTTPVVSYLKKQFPTATVDFLCDPCGKNVLCSNPFIDNLFIYGARSALGEILSVRNRHYDAVIDFMNNPRTRYLTWLSGAHYRVGPRYGYRKLFYSHPFSEPKAVNYVPRKKIELIRSFLLSVGEKPLNDFNYLPELFLSQEDEDFADAFLYEKKYLKGSFVVMAPAHRHPIRQWVWQGFQETALSIYEKFGLKSLLSWGPREFDLMKKIQNGHEEFIDIFPQTTLRQMAAIFKRSKFLITNDSGNMHVAVSVRVPTITIYGPTRPDDWNPSSILEFSKYNPHIAVNKKELSCLGCHLKTCPIGHLCMNELPSSRVSEAAEKMIKEIYGDKN